MLLKEYFENLNNFIKEHPEALDMIVISSIDDEGNGFNLVSYSPSIGIYEDREFIPIDHYNDNGREINETNAVCIN